MAPSSVARGLRLSHRCDIQRVPSGSNPAARETMTAALPCSAVYPASVEQAERAGMAFASRLMVIYTAAVTAQPDWRLVTEGIDYRIRAMSRWPNGAAHFIEMLLEDE
jgi:hypothetical protein